MPKPKLHPKKENVIHYSFLKTAKLAVNKLDKNVIQIEVKATAYLFLGNKIDSFLNPIVIYCDTPQ